MRGRGLKQFSLQIFNNLYQVAPYAGAWIETSLMRLIEISQKVAPYAGAWIETGQHTVYNLLRCVAPYAGAWIETIKKGTY